MGCSASNMNNAFGTEWTRDEPKTSIQHNDVNMSSNEMNKWDVGTAGDLPATFNSNSSSTRRSWLDRNVDDYYDELDEALNHIHSKNKINELLSLLGPDELYCDPDFPADVSSLSYIEGMWEEQGIEWLRPKDITGAHQTARLLSEGVSRDDIMQGSVGDCWFLSACAAVSQKPKFMQKIIPYDQPLCGKDYNGVVHFRFWRFGKWMDVFIDDRLPTKHGHLIFAHCLNPAEFWIALLEKAYAKLHGCYEAIEGGQTMDALVDLTGGLAERYELNSSDYTMFGHIQKAYRSGAFIACSKKGDWRNSNEADANGLVSGHAYTLTNVLKIRHQKGEVKLVRIRNPWGDGTEWKGSWSDKDSNWKWVDDDTKNRMNFNRKPDGEFWMSYKDFCKHFTEVTICTIGPDYDGDGVSDKAGCVLMTNGKWVSEESAGGSRNDLQKFATNPQFLISLEEPDDFDVDEDDPDTEGKCSIVICLMQLPKFQRGKSPARSLLQIGFVLYRTKKPDSRLPGKHFRYNYDSGKSGVYINYREVSARFELEPGHYVLIPSTFNPNDSAMFRIRAFSEKKFTMKSLE
ncbi:calpain-B-like [Tubulanus polymorphus]|uniref:calpain-B-like n=1 Tax=Tubulanus polymorphus TaxID=672921 RepID=UPI003DA6C347